MPLFLELDLQSKSSVGLSLCNPNGVKEGDNAKMGKLSVTQST